MILTTLNKMFKASKHRIVITLVSFYKIHTDECSMLEELDRGEQDSSACGTNAHCGLNMSQGHVHKVSL